MVYNLKYSHSILTFLCEDCNNFYQFEKRRAFSLKEKYKKFLCYNCRQYYSKKSRQETNLKKYGCTVAMNTKENIQKRNDLIKTNLNKINQKTKETLKNTEV